MLKHFFIAALFFSFINAKAQTSDTGFQKEWAEIDTLIIKRNLPKSALEKVDMLYSRAKEKQLDVQLIKCLVYKMGLEERVLDKKPNATIATLQAEIGSTKNELARSILYSLLASKYLQYYNNNRYTYYSRSKTVNFQKEDMETWHADDFGNAISESFAKSLVNPRLLQQTSLSPYDALLVIGNARNLRPTLFDLLAHEALDYFKTGDYYLTKPAYAFEIKNINALAPIKIFLNAAFEVTDSSSHLLKSLDLFKQLIVFHLNDDNKDALIDVDLERVKWVYANIVNEDKDEQYNRTLESIGNYHSPRASQAHFLLAQTQTQLARAYQPFGDSTNRMANVKALKIIDNALSRFKEENEGTSNLKNLRFQILQKNIVIETERVNIPNKAFRALVTYKNVDTLFIRILKMDSSLERLDFKGLAKQKPYTTYIQPLPATNDYQTHSVEIKMDALPVGEYLLLTSSGAGFVDSIHKMSSQIIYSSNISHIRNNHDHFVLNRETGEPLKNINVVITKQQWNSSLRKNENIKVAERKTDRNGFFGFKPSEAYANYEFAFSSSNDRLHLGETEYLYSYNNDEEEDDDDDEDYEKDEALEYEEDHARIFFFTDRGIYRPGQVVYFKGIAITKDFKTKNSKLYARKDADSILVNLKDANNKNIDSLYLKTNEYGSISGKFILPQNVLTGEFELEAENHERSGIYFRVEEYKRPKFYVEFEKAKGSYRLDDSVTIIGTAKAYAGNAIDGAKVKFNVRRNARFIYDWLWIGRPRPYSPTIQITNGEMATDANGKFSITFKAAADKNINKNTDPLFDFSIEADITDITGETRSSNAKVTVGYKGLVLAIKAPKIIEADSLTEIAIHTANLSGEKEKAEVTITIHSLQTPQRLIRKRLWQRPDRFVMDKLTYINHFPNDDYDDELNENLWPSKGLVYKGTINTDSGSHFSIPANKLHAGYYKVEATTRDKYGNEIKAIELIQLFDRTSTAYAQHNFSHTVNNYIEPNETARFIAGSMAEKVMVIRKTERPKLKSKERYNYTFHTYGKGLHNINYKADETDRGNVGISEVFVINNRMYTNHYDIMVPFSNKELQVNYASYRNKTDPGNKETWKVTIQGSKGQNKAAELLTSMYDASLDQFHEHDWSIPDIWRAFTKRNHFSNGIDFGSSQSYNNYERNSLTTIATIYDNLVKSANLREYIIRRELRTLPGEKFTRAALNFESTLNGVDTDRAYISQTPYGLSGASAGLNVSSQRERGEETVVIGYGTKRKEGFDFDLKAMKAPAFNLTATKVNNIAFDPYDTDVEFNDKENESSKIQPRKNFNETAFFFPNLYTDTSGNYSFSFTMPEALTQWKWLSFAHSKDLSFGTEEAYITTQKTLMVQPNAPRFMREGDQMEFVAKVSNTSDKEITGQAILELVDATTGNSVDGWFQNSFPVQYFTVAAGQSNVVKFPMQVPFNYNKPLTWRVVAKAGEFSDGEENTLPVLTNRMLVTETLPLYLKPGEKEKSFIFDKLLNNKSESLTHEGITVEYTANPIWNVVQSLPYLMEYPYECAEQTFNRLFANAIAASIVNKHPKIKEQFEQWKKDTTALQSNLQKNEELKQVLLQETPWVLNAENEAQQKKNIALLFDVVKMSQNIDGILEKLKQLQNESGGFAWFKGGKENRYITNYIITGIGKLKRSNALTKEQEEKMQPIISKALNYLDAELKDDYENLKKSKTDLSKYQLSPHQIQYLYMRSFYSDPKNNFESYNYYYNQAKQYWNKQNTYHAAMIALVLHRNNERRFVNVNILPSLLENTVEDSAKGTLYWKNQNTCFWYQSPIEHQSMMIEAVNEIATKEGFQEALQKVDAAKTWLILSKQTNNWKTTIATADACYALLTTGSNWIGNNQQVQIKLGNQPVTNNQQPTANGYIKTRIEGNKVKPIMGNINITIEQLNNQTVKQSSPSYGAVYWQYFEDLDKITEASSPLSIKKKLFIERNTDKGKVLELLSDTNQLKVGDKLVVRMELRTDREMEYLHLKDMRAAGTEPINVLSGYKWQQGLGYYEATKDASTNFFIDHLNKGTYVFEYPLFITHVGTFSVGIATIQCMYAPEFTSHSEGIKITVK